MSFLITVDGVPRLEHILDALLETSSDLSPLMERIGMALESSTIERFDDERAPDGSRWAPSARAQTEGGKTLTDSARLKQSIGYVAGSDQVEVGTNTVYAGAHQSPSGKVRSHRRTITQAFGLPLRSPVEVMVPGHSRDMPARKFIGLSGDDEQEIEALGRGYFAEGLGLELE